MPPPALPGGEPDAKSDDSDLPPNPPDDAAPAPPTEVPKNVLPKSASQPAKPVSRIAESGAAVPARSANRLSDYIRTR